MAKVQFDDFSEVTSFFFGETEKQGVTSTLQHGLSEFEALKKAELTQNQAFPLLFWSIIDLLARYYSGQLENQGGMVRMKKFLKSFFRHDRRDTQTLLLFRNAVSHSISMYAFDASAKREIRFNLVSEGPLVNQKSNVQIEINTSELHSRLYQSIEAYKQELQQSEQLQKRFQKVFKKLGYIVS